MHSPPRAAVEPASAGTCVSAGPLLESGVPGLDRVLKMRDSDYGSDVRHYTVGRDGLTVLEPERTEPGILGGIAELPSGARTKRSALEAETA